MTAHVCVLSSCYGSYDQIDPPPAQSANVAEWIMVTDTPGCAPGWTEVIEPRPHMHPRLAAKVAKCLPWEYTDADTTIWADAACRFIRNDTVSWLLDQSAEHTLSQFNHPWRQCALDEAEASAEMLKYSEHPVLEQAHHYEVLGHPRQWGLWATGLIVRRTHGSWSEQENLTEFGLEWLAEQVRWTYQDQVSEAVVLRHRGMRPRSFNAPLHGSGYVDWLFHRDEL